MTALPLFDGKRRPRGYKPARLPAPRELDLHIAVVDLLRRFSAPGWLWWHTPNGEVRDKRSAAKLKAMGVRPGVPDLCLLSPTGVFHGLELKRGRSRMTAEQQAWGDAIIACGARFAVVRTIDQAMALFAAWDCLRIRSKASEARATGALGSAAA